MQQPMQQMILINYLHIVMPILSLLTLGEYTGVSPPESGAYESD